MQFLKHILNFSSPTLLKPARAGASHRLLPVLALAFLAMIATPAARAAFIDGSFTNYFGGAYTNVSIIQKCGTSLADGTAYPQGIPIRVYPQPNGWFTNQLAVGNYYITNAALVQGPIYFVVPDDAGPTVYNIYQAGVWHSGGNFFVGGGAGTVTATNVTSSAITNGLGYLPVSYPDLIASNNAAMLSATNLTQAERNALFLTNTIILTTATNLQFAALQIATNLVNAERAALNATNTLLLLAIANSNAVEIARVTAQINGTNAAVLASTAAALIATNNAILATVLAQLQGTNTALLATTAAALNATNGAILAAVLAQLIATNNAIIATATALTAAERTALNATNSALLASTAAAIIATNNAILATTLAQIIGTNAANLALTAANLNATNAQLIITFNSAVNGASNSILATVSTSINGTSNALYLNITNQGASLSNLCVYLRALIGVNTNVLVTTVAGSVNARGTNIWSTVTQSYTNINGLAFWTNTPAGGVAEYVSGGLFYHGSYLVGTPMFTDAGSAPPPVNAFFPGGPLAGANITLTPTAAGILITGAGGGIGAVAAGTNAFVQLSGNVYTINVPVGSFDAPGAALSATNDLATNLRALITSSIATSTNDLNTVMRAALIATNNAIIASVLAQLQATNTTILTNFSAQLNANNISILSQVASQINAANTAILATVAANLAATNAAILATVAAQLLATNNALIVTFNANLNTASNAIVLAMISTNANTLAALVATNAAILASTAAALIATNNAILATAAANLIATNNALIVTFTAQINATSNSIFSATGPNVVYTNILIAGQPAFTFATNSLKFVVINLPAANGSQYNYTSTGNIWTNALNGYYVTNNLNSGNYLLCNSGGGVQFSLPDSVNLQNAAWTPVGGSGSCVSAYCAAWDPSTSGVIPVNLGSVGILTNGSIILLTNQPQLTVNMPGIEDGVRNFTNLQHAINYALSTNFPVTAVFGGVTNYSNLGYEIKMGAANFYSPTGYLVNFTYPTALKISGGVSWGSMCSADSNVFVINSTFTGFGNKFECDNAVIAGISNVLGALVRTPQGSTPCNDIVFNDDTFCTIIGGMTNYTPGNNFFIIPNNCPLLGLVGIAVYGDNDLIVNHCIFNGLADGIYAMHDHNKIQNNQFYTIGVITHNMAVVAQNTNLWSRSDQNQFFGPGSESLQNEELSFGAAYVLDDGGDTEIHGDHIFQTGMGFKIGISQAQFYGITKIYDEHFEPSGVNQIFMGLSDEEPGSQINVENIFSASGFWHKYVLCQDSLSPAILNTNQPVPMVGTIFEFDRNAGFNFLVGDTNILSVSAAGIAANGSGITNLASTRFIALTNGFIFTNSTSRVLHVNIPALASSPATTLGRGEIDLKIGPIGGTQVIVSHVAIDGGVTSVIGTNAANLTGDVPSGWLWSITNNVSGTGYTAGLDPTGTNQATYY